MTSVMNTSSRVSEGNDGGRAFSQAMMAEKATTESVDSENKLDSRVSDDEFSLSRVEIDDYDVKVKPARMESGKARVSGPRFGNSKVEKLSMKEDDVARISSSEGRKIGSDFASAYAMVDEGAAARMSEAFGSEAEKAMSFGFEPGDMVWGKVKSHPWWPGHVFNEAFVSSAVRRTKHQGHVLVAFFGDSSYGWFDPAELIPFEPNYAEKSRQTSSRSFLKAVDEAIDEASRRCALGLTCRCRNPFNFRPTNVRSYFAVDVGGYELGALYSVMQIKKSRERFQPMDVLQFVQNMAVTPMSFDRRNMDFIRNKATVFAYRKATFEEFDATYAEAFGMQPARPSREELDQIAKNTNSRAPLTGPMVTAEALVERKNASKAAKVKEHMKKDKYLFKRRDEVSEPRSNHVPQGHEGIIVPSVNKEATAPGDYVVQMRTAIFKQDLSGTTTSGDDLGRAPHGEGIVSVDRNSEAANSNISDAQRDMSHVDPPLVESFAHSSTSGSEVVLEDRRLQYDEENVSNRSITSGGAGGSTSVGLDASSEEPDTVHRSSKNLLAETMIDSKGESLKFDVKVEDLESHNQRSFTSIDDPNQVLPGFKDRDILESVATSQLPIDTKSPGIVPHVTTDGLVKKTKALKRSAADALIVGEKRKKKKESHFETSSEHSHKRFKTTKEGEIPRKSAGKSIGIGLPLTEKSQLDLQQRNIGSSVSSESASPLPNVDLDQIEVELPKVVSDMLALALDPFYGVERNSAAVVLQVLLRFRSLVYQKSLVLSPTSETEALESSVGKTPASSVSEISPGEDVRGLAPKRPKYLSGPDDPTKAGRKRNRSDRQEEMSAKRVKKLKELKSMTAEKKAGAQKIPEVQREQKDTNISASAKQIKPNLVKKPEAPARGMAEPAMLVMKFPEQTNLPSGAELKARFGRFGPLDHSAMRVFWKTFTCRVVFKYKAHAQAAYNYAVRNNLFGNVNVHYHLKSVGGPAPPPEAESAKWPAVNGSSDDVPHFRPTGGGGSILGPGPRARQSNSELKSCLKRPCGGDEVGLSPSTVPREVPRVKFMLGEGEGESNSNDQNKSGDGGAIAMDVNSKKLQKFIPQKLAPVLLPFPPRPVGHPPITAEPKLEPINFKNYFNTPTESPISTSKKIDISQEMLSLLWSCNDIVSDVKGSLGYVPYHPL